MGQCAIYHYVLIAKDNLDSQRECGGVTDKRTKGHGVDHTHYPGVFIAKYFVLVIKVGFGRIW